MHTKRLLYLGLLIAALLVAACSPQATPEPTAVPTPLPTPLPLEGGVCSVDSPCAPEDVPTGFTEDGLPYRGNPDAPVTLEEHSEFQ
jgi:hypothetical protein